MYETIHSIKSHVRFSISPFGIYRPQESGGMPPPIVGLDPYTVSKLRHWNNAHTLLRFGQEREKRREINKER